MTRPLLSMPALVRPQLPALVEAPPVGPGWQHEIKHDGYRTLGFLEGSRARLVSRGGYDWTGRYGRLPAALGRLGARQAILDGEVVVQRQDGGSDYDLLLDALKRPAGAPFVFYAFDLLWLDGRDLRPEPLEARQAQLEELLAPHVDQHAPVRLVESWPGDGRSLLAACAEHHLEGVVSKRLGSPYRSGASSTWLKSKCFQESEFVIVGWRGRLAHLLLAEAQADACATSAGWGRAGRTAAPQPCWTLWARSRRRALSCPDRTSRPPDGVVRSSGRASAISAETQAATSGTPAFEE